MADIDASRSGDAGDGVTRSEDFDAPRQQPTPSKCPHCGAPAKPDALGCGVCGISLTQAPRSLAVGTEWSRTLINCSVLGGYGHPLTVGALFTVTFTPHVVSIRHHQETFDLCSLDDLLGIEIGGPGQVTSGAASSAEASAWRARPQECS
jgi:hypothetical protein